MKKNFNLILTGLFFGVLSFCLTPTGSASERSSNESAHENQTDPILALMSLKERVGQLNQHNGSWDMTGPPPVPLDGRDNNTVHIGTSTLHHVVLPPFKAGVAAFMNGFNVLNSVPVRASTYLQRDLLKDRWGFDGFIDSDWSSIGEMIAHGYIAYSTGAATAAIRGGSDMDMECFIYLKEGFVGLTRFEDVSNEPVFPFGYGLSDTTFDYSDLNLNTVETAADARVEVSVTVSNTGNVKGKETVQLYISDLAARVTQPIKDKKGFSQIELNPGESREVRFMLDHRKLSFYDNSGNLVLEPVAFDVFVGANCQDVLQESSVLK